MLKLKYTVELKVLMVSVEAGFSNISQAAVLAILG
jgi:hypothetical protein